MLFTFPQGDTRRIQLPDPLGPEEVGSWRTSCPRQTIRLQALNDDTSATDALGFYPIQAVYLGCKTRRPTSCNGYPSFQNDGLARCAVWLNVVAVAKDPSNPQAIIPTGGQDIGFVIKVSSNCVPEPLLSGVIHLPAQTRPGDPIPVMGLIGMVSGVLGNQFEFWAKVLRNEEPQNPAVPVEVSLQLDVDRLGDRMGALLGTVAGGSPSGILPIVNGS